MAYPPSMFANLTLIVIIASDECIATFAAFNIQKIVLKII
jgi:hypothetical protein